MLPCGRAPTVGLVPEGSSPRPAILVSACLLGVRCNNAGAASPSAVVAALAADHDLVPVCPEVAGGLTIPRPAAELQPDGSVRTVEGGDVTTEYRHGAAVAVAAARAAGAATAVLRRDRRRAGAPRCTTARSPAGVYPAKE